MKTDFNEVLRYLGCPSPDESTVNTIKSCSEEIESKITPYRTYRIFPVMSDENGVKFLGSDIYFQSRDLSRLFINCRRCAVIAATLGYAADKLISLYGKTDVSRAVIMDACCSSAIEWVCDDIEREIKEKENVKFLTIRFSPGYGDFDIKNQKSLLNMIDAQKKTGLCVNSSMLLTPMKSVTAVIGISDKPVYTKNKCEMCGNRENCIYKDKCKGR